MTRGIVPAMGPRAGTTSARTTGAWLVNAGLRLAILGFAVEAARSPDDPRFAGKGIPVRNLILASAGITLPMPILHRWRGSGHPYPVAIDSLLLSILALDMAGNSLNLYERRWRFDLIPHCYGPMAGYATLRAMGVGRLPATLWVNGVHAALEVQEALGDVVFGTRNVRGWWDTIGDLSAGVVGSILLPLGVSRLGGRLRFSRPEAHRSYSGA